MNTQAEALCEYMAQLHDRQPEEVLLPEHLETYRKQHSDIYQRIVQLHHTIISLERIIDFPFQSLCSPSEMTFWDTVHWNFVHMGVVLLSGLIDDKASGAHDLDQFRTRIFEQWIRPGFRDEYRNQRIRTELSSVHRSILDRVKKMRNKIVVHRELERASLLPLTSVSGILVRELRELFDAVERQFRACCFCPDVRTTSRDYETTVVDGKRKPTSLDNILDCVARNSKLVNQPEETGQYWAVLREHVSADELRVMNEYRRKFAKSEA